ncbi:hypothetical protein ACWKWU_04070 [Chitinophaga lutea]
MKNIIIAASVLGAAAAGVVWYTRNRRQADAAIGQMKDAARNAYKKMQRKGKEAVRMSNSMMNESLA